MEQFQGSIRILWIVISVITFLCMMYVIYISFLEKEKRAAKRASLVLLGFILILSLPCLLPAELFYTTTLILVIISTLIALILLFPTRIFEKKQIQDQPLNRIDERNIMFSRNLYEPGSDRYKAYYNEFPEHKAPDDHFRSKPGLLGEDSVYYDPLTFNASHDIFKAIHALYPHIDGEVEKIKSELSSREILEFIQVWMKKRGAISVGVTEMKDYHWYSIIGRGEDYGKPAALDHSHGIAFSVEMDKEMMDTAPQGPTVLESARQYMNAAVIATEMAMFLRSLGYEARAHIDGNYRLVCPLVAKDAGLGEIGRMGLLMTPELGPRVRLGVITTNCELPVSKPKDYTHMISFCRICKKCADVCPSRAISFNDREIINGVKRWQINQESCYTLWCIAGTDCGKCMSDCPYSHPDNLFHNAIRSMLKNSSIFRYIAVKMDDFFYGRKPKMKPVPKWMNSNI